MFQPTRRRPVTLISLLALLTALSMGQAPSLAQTSPADAQKGIHPLSLLHNTFVKLTKDKRLKIVVIGNSVSHGMVAEGKPTISYYPYLLDWFKAQFPDAQIELKTSIIFAIGPELQLFRMEDKLFAEKPDLVVVEFGAANGAWGDAGREITDRATEGYIRRLRFMMPQADCLMNMGLFKTMLEDYAKGTTPNSVLFQYSVASHYGCALADSEKALAQKIAGGEPYETYMGDFIHPSARGYQVHGQVITQELDRQYAQFKATPQAELALTDHAFPKSTVHSDPWLFPRLVPALYAEELQGFAVAEHGRVKFLAADKAGASGSFTAPRGRIVGMLLRSPEHQGSIEVRLDGKGEWTRLALKDQPRFTEGDDPQNWLQRTFFAADGLTLYCQRVDFRVSANPEVKDAYAVQLIGFLVIERDAQLPFSRP